MRLRYFTIFLTVIMFIVAFNAFGQTASYDTVSVYDIQYVPDPATNEQSPLFGDTVVVKAMVMHYSRELYVGARWACYVVDPDSFPKPLRQGNASSAINVGELRPSSAAIRA